MKQIITQYVITDPDKKFFWQRNTFYDHSFSGARYHARFTKSVLDSSFLSKKEAESTLENFGQFYFVQFGNDYNVDIKSLIIVPVTITYEL